MLIGIIFSFLFIKKTGKRYYISVIISIFINFLTFIDGFDSNITRLILGSVLGFNIGVLYSISIKLLLTRGSK